MSVNLCSPITLGDIINALMAICTLAAVVVAIVANHNSTKQLKAALAMQEQTKNVDLMKERLHVIELIQKGQFEEALTPTRVLFPQWESEIEKLVRLNNEDIWARSNKKAFIRELEERGKHDTALQEAFEKLRHYEAAVSKPEPSPDLVNTYNNFCMTLRLSFSPSGLNEDQDNYCYGYLSDQAAKTSDNLENQKEFMIEFMTEYIAESIKPIGTRESR